MYRLALLALLLLASTSALAGPVCQTLEAAITEVKPLAIKMHGEIIELDPKETKAYLAIVNEQPPVTHMTADSLLLFSVPERGAVIGLVKDGCVSIAARIASSVHDKALKAARGTDS